MDTTFAMMSVVRTVESLAEAGAAVWVPWPGDRSDQETCQQKHGLDASRQQGDD
jgi:hypothetical protein